MRLYQQLQELEPGHVLPRGQQLEMANHLAQSQRQDEAVSAYESFLKAYPGAADAAQVALLVGMLCNRHLHDHARARVHLRNALAGLSLDSQRSLALQELAVAERQLGQAPAG
jgi:outer membrane protein assembly factor BamD (BamD/ComL family)